ncbi:MAG: hypothetical protein NC084_03275 [Bacteroides sp.]|nr:hypothetical protein [Eubacterium sp.]MCM1417571.1 hypothetical protein [Roseburia sp.]MCM1461718.1 hypothetical protein [Bacteroides sp.]
MLFQKKKKNAGVDDELLRRLETLSFRYVTERDPETLREKRLGDGGAANVIDGEFVIVCGGRNVLRCPLDRVTAAELMNRSGLTAKGFDLDEGREKSVIAYYSDGSVGVDRAKRR